MTELSNFGDDTDENHLHGMRLVIFTITLMLGQFLTALDTTVLGEQTPACCLDLRCWGLAAYMSYLKLHYCRS